MFCSLRYQGRIVCKIRVNSTESDFLANIFSTLYDESGVDRSVAARVKASAEWRESC